MEGPRDIDSLEFHTRTLIRKLIELTGESEHDAVHRAIDERIRRLTGPTTADERRQEMLHSLETTVWRYRDAGQAVREEEETFGDAPEEI